MKTKAIISLGIVLLVGSFWLGEWDTYERRPVCQKYCSMYNTTVRYVVPGGCGCQNGKWLIDENENR